MDKTVHSRMKLNKRSNFAKPPEEQIEEKTRKTDRMENRAMAKLCTLAEGKLLNLEYVMEYRLTDVCLAIFNINGSMRKPLKSILVECFTLKETTVDNRMVVLVDMGMLWRIATPTSTDYSSGCFTWGDYASKLFQVIILGHPTAEEYHLINDRNDITFTLKYSEHLRRKEQYFCGSRNVFFEPKNKVPPAKSFKSFFSNDGNKVRLQEFLFREFQHLAKKHDKSIVYTLKDKCYDLNPLDTKEEFTCHQHEADTRLFYHASLLDTIS